MNKSHLFLSFIIFFKLKIKNIFYNLFSNNIPNPNTFTTEVLQSDMNISQIIIEINGLLPQFSEFINQFNNVINQHSISVITDSTGNMSLDVPKNMSDSDANQIGLRISIIDRLISTKGQEINSLFTQGVVTENKLKLENPNYVSQLTDKLEEYKRLKASYKHH